MRSYYDMKRLKQSDGMKRYPLDRLLSNSSDLKPRLLSRGYRSANRVVG